jgi:hypothetical protein
MKYGSESQRINIAAWRLAYLKSGGVKRREKSASAASQHRQLKIIWRKSK